MSGQGEPTAGPPSPAVVACTMRRMEAVADRIRCHSMRASVDDGYREALLHLSGVIIEALDLDRRLSGEQWDGEVMALERQFRQPAARHTRTPGAQGMPR